MNVFDELAHVANEAARDPASGMTWAKWAIDFLADASQRKLLRKANQIGGSTVLCADCVHEVRGTNPYRERMFAGPINVVWAGVSLEQMYQPGGVVSKLWQMLPVGEVHPKIRFVPGKGIIGTKYPHIPIVAGPGAGSNIILRTYQQDAQTVAGMTIHHVYGDEPMPEALYAEFNPRLWKNNGRLTIGFTPTPDMPDMTYLRTLVDDGVFREHHVPMTEAACWPEGYARPFYTADDIARMMAETPEAQRPMRFQAAWDPFVTDRWLTSFNRSSNVSSFNLADIPRENVVIVGTDHGLQPGKHATMFVAVVDGDTPRPRAWVFAEYNPEGRNTPEENAEGIIATLRGLGLDYWDVDEWVGDQPARDRTWVVRKSNKELRTELARALSIDVNTAKFIYPPDKSRGTVLGGLSTMNAMFERGDLVVHERCDRFIKACEEFRGRKDDKHKDILDAGRYALMRGITGRSIVKMVARY